MILINLIDLKRKRISSHFFSDSLSFLGITSSFTRKYVPNYEINIIVVAQSDARSKKVKCIKEYNSMSHTLKYQSDYTDICIDID